MSLKEYRQKRDFGKTPEPGGKERKSGAGGLRYVVQKHSARRLHYDFRLEIDGVLKSWAIPKGPSTDPAEKRLAVQVEDHPLEYSDFEGIIPKDQYGGGTVMLWDRGQWVPEGNPAEGHRKGKLKFEVKGEKLRGGWTLVRMSGEASDEGKNWLLIKEKDKYAARGKAIKEIIDAKPKSVASGRSIDEIAEAADTVWEDGKSQKTTPKKPATKTTKKANNKRDKDAKADPPARDPVETEAPDFDVSDFEAIDLSAVPGAKKTNPPDELQPQLATLSEKPPEGTEWLHEVKFDGYRMVCFSEADKTRLISRNGKDWTKRFSVIARAVTDLPAGTAIFDGEVVALKENGISDFQTLQNAMKAGQEIELVYYLFDLVYCNGYDLRSTPLIERKRLLYSLLATRSRNPAKGRPLCFSRHIEGRGGDVFRSACRLGMEGIMAKRRDSVYATGRRTRTWLKMRCGKRQEFVIGGFTEPSGSRQGFGALLVSYYDDKQRLHYCGRVGTGFDEAALKTIHARLLQLEQKTPAFHDPPKGIEARGVHWIQPELVGEVSFTEWTNEDRLRHPVFLGLREDKDPKTVVLETPLPATEVSIPDVKNSVGKNQRDNHRNMRNQKNSNNDPIAGVRLTNPERILYPDFGLTKRRLAEFYDEIADWILPHIVGRPLSIVRCPQGHHKDCFYQKHFNETISAPICGIEVEEKDGKQIWLSVDNRAGLIALTQYGVLEIHPWGSRADKLDRPDRLIFDLDPGEGVEWASVIEATRELRALLEDLGLKSFIKTSGGKGLHVYAPIARREGWDELKDFAHAVVETMAKGNPTRYITLSTKARRKGRIYLDYLRNAPGATSVAPYSTRARPGAPVSTPITWEELSPDLRSNAYTVENLPQRLADLKSDPWVGFFDLRQAITQTMKRKVGMK